MEKFEYAQDVMRDTASCISMACFNRRIDGESYSQAMQYPHEQAGAGGWYLADKMIADGRLFYNHTEFHHSHENCNGFAFSYGGFMVCNTCGNGNLQKEWWKIKVRMDGNAWQCLGTGFENFQESDNYAFGDTREDAIKNYGDLMTLAAANAAQPTEQPE